MGDLLAATGGKATSYIPISDEGPTASGAVSPSKGSGGGRSLRKTLYWIKFHCLGLPGRLFVFGFQFTGHPKFIDLAVPWIQREIDLDPKGYLAPVGHFHMGVLLGWKSHVTLNISTITEAVAHGRASLEGDYAEDGQHIINLSESLLHRWWGNGSQNDDLEDCIALRRRGMAIVDKQKDPYPKKVYRHALMSALDLKIQLCSDPAAATEELVPLARQSVEANPSEIPLRMSLWRALYWKFQYSTCPNVADIDEAISIIQSLAKEAHSNLPNPLGKIIDYWMYPGRILPTMLGECLCVRGKITQSIDDINKGLEVVHAALKEYPSFNIPNAYDPSKALLAQTYNERYKIGRDPADLEEGIKYLDMLRSGDKNLPLPLPIILLNVDLHRQTQNAEGVMQAYSEILDRYPQALIIGRNYRPTVWQLRNRSLPMEAAGACVSCGRYQQGLELLERSRSLGWSRNLQLRAEAGTLEKDYPELAKRFLDLRLQIEKMDLEQIASSSAAQPQSQVLGGIKEAPWEKRFMLTQMFDRLLEDIRERKGYEDFLSTPGYEELKHASSAGPVVVINIDTYRSDAFILAQSSLDRPHIVPLANNIKDLTAQWSDRLLEGVEGMNDGSLKEPDFSRHTLQPILVELWNEIVLPVREALKALTPYARRIWWCPTGRMSFLPLHLVTNGVGDTDIFPILIPSYTTTLWSLLRARSSLARHGKQVKLLAVSCPSVEGFQEIGGTSKEVEEVFSGSEATILHSELATVENVKTNMSTHTWLHLACHGLQSVDEPYKSRFVLEDGFLYLDDIIAAQLKRPEFAFLSACHTATGIVQLSDEAMHLAAGLQFAGYCGIVATMWSVHDKTARRLAKLMYSQLFRKSSETPNVEDAAEALWKAIETLKRKKVPISRLAPFVHIGV